MHRNPINLKPAYLERIQKLLTGDDFKKYLESLKEQPLRSIRCNTLKISPEKLIPRLKEKGWKIKQPWKDNPEVIIIVDKLEPGELGRSLEHLLGYYYIQDLASMLPVIALDPKPGETILDLAAAPGSKSTQISAAMKNTGTLIANDVSLGRIKILAANLERCGASNSIITRKDGIALCARLKKSGFMFDKILIDAPCSGEGTLRSSPKTAIMWNPKTIKSLSRLQKALVTAALDILNVGGTIIYSTCTHAPEENEGVLNYILQNHKNVEVKSANLPIKCRSGVGGWGNIEYNNQVKKSCRIYPHDNETEGFFVSKLVKVK